MEIWLSTKTKASLPIRRLTRLILAGVALVLGLSSLAMSQQTPSCPEDFEVANPPFADVGEPPNVSTWKKLSQLPTSCQIDIQYPAKLTVALSSLFEHEGTIEDLAQRLGAISKTKNLRYWSVSNEKWRRLISNAYALESANTKSARTDFTAQELLGGNTWFFAQNDTSTWGLNRFSLKIVDSSPDHLILESSNTSRLRLGPVTLFNPGDAQTVLFLQRFEGTVWQYFSLSVIKKSGLPLTTKSVINRQAAFYRLLIGQAPNAGPPLAP